MKPVSFPEANKTLTKPEGMDECGDLPVWNDGSHCLSCWKIPWRDRLRILWRGKIWLWVFSGRTQPPVSLQTQNPFKAQPEPKTRDVTAWQPETDEPLA